MPQELCKPNRPDKESSKENMTPFSFLLWIHSWLNINHNCVRLADGGKKSAESHMLAAGYTQ